MPARISTIASRFSFSSGGSKRNLDLALEIGDALFESGNFFLRHLREIGIVGSGEFAIVVQLLARGLAVRPISRAAAFIAGMFAHDFAGAFAVLEKARIGDLAFELLEAFAFALDERD